MFLIFHVNCPSQFHNVKEDQCYRFQNMSESCCQKKAEQPASFPLHRQVLLLNGAENAQVTQQTLDAPPKDESNVIVKVKYASICNIDVGDYYCPKEARKQCILGTGIVQYVNKQFCCAQ